MHENLQTRDKVRAGSTNAFTKNAMPILLNIIDKCNLTCSYCINSSIRKHNRMVDIKNLIKLLAIVGKLDREIYHFAIAGGEPFLYPHLDTLCNKFYEIFQHNKLNIVIATNAAIHHNTLIKFLEKTRQTRTWLNISVHFEQIDSIAYVKNISLIPDEFINRMKFKFLVSGRTVLRIKNMIDMLTDCGVKNIVMSLVYDNSGNLVDDFTEQEKTLAFELVKQFPFGEKNLFFETIVDGKKTTILFNKQDRLFNKNLVNYHGMWCAAGSHSLRVAPSGMVRRCFGFPEEFNITSLSGNLPESFQHPVRCPVHRCGCPPFIALPKWRNPADAPEYLRQPGDTL